MAFAGGATGQVSVTPNNCVTSFKLQRWTGSSWVGVGGTYFSGATILFIIGGLYRIAYTATGCAEKYSEFTWGGPTCKTITQPGATRGRYVINFYTAHAWNFVPYSGVTIHEESLSNGNKTLTVEVSFTAINASKLLGYVEGSPDSKYFCFRLSASWNGSTYTFVMESNIPNC